MNKEAKKKNTWHTSQYGFEMTTLWKVREEKEKGDDIKRNINPQRSFLKIADKRLHFWGGINLLCVWVCVHTFSFELRVGVTHTESEMICGSFEVFTDSFQHKSGIVTGSHPCLPGFTSPLCSPSHSLLSPETCHHPLCSSSPPTCPRGLATNSIPS